MSWLIKTMLTASFILMLAPIQVQAQHDLHAPDLQSLARSLAGEWTLKVHFEPAQEAPNGFDGAGEETWRATVGGLTVIEEESFSAGPVKMTIVGLFWQDPKTRELRALDCNNQNPKVCGLQDAIDGVEVHWNGKELMVEEKELGSNGEQMISRIVWSNITSASFIETGYIGPPGGPFKKGMTLEARRKVVHRTRALGEREPTAQISS